MQDQLIRRLVLVIPTLLAITLIVFSSVRFLPGDVIDQLSGEQGAANAQVRKQLEEDYSLDKNVALQYVEWLGGVVHGDFGTSIISGRPVRQTLGDRLPATFELGLLALAVSLLIAVPVGITSAVKQDSLWDYASRSLAIAFLSIPAFFLALLVLIYGFRWFGWTPPIRYYQFWDKPVENLRTMWIPALILGAGLSASVTRLTRSMMLEVLRQDYIRTAHAKGLRARIVIGRHALRNAMIPVITVVGLQVPVLIGGTVILERIFSIPGMGNLLLDSISQRDYPVVQGVVLLSASAVVFSNLLVDVIYSIVDPRIRV